MKKYQEYIVKAVIYISRNTFLGRGILRKKIINILANYLSKLNVNFSLPLFKIKFHGLYINFYFDAGTGLKLYFEKNELYELNFLKKILISNTWFIDIGAYIGMYSLIACNKNNKNINVKVLSFEPSPNNYVKLKNNFKLLQQNNKNIKKKYYLENLAISNKKKIDNFIIDKNNNTSSRIIRKKNNLKNFKKIKVKSDKLINKIVKYKIKKISCLKIDTEGHEIDILKNYFSYKNHVKPNFCILENQKSNILQLDLDSLMYKNCFKVLYKTKANTIYKRLYK